MGRAISLSPAGAFGAALLPALVLAAFVLVDRVHDNPTLFRAFGGAALALGAWNLVLLAASQRGGRRLTLEIAPRAQHYLQACAQASVLLYWGWHWAPVYDAVPLIAGQLVFAYGFDLLLGWSRRDNHRLGFGPVPVIFSINLFLWFTDDWFHFQFLLVAIGFAAKELIRWERDGRLVHIFNPASFPLAVFALALIATGMSDVTRGQDIAISQFYPPQMYLWIFLIALPGQYLFGVTTMTMAAVVTTYLFGLAYFAVTGVYFFYDSYIPIAVFLGMHLLFTDPSTSPRTELGRDRVRGAVWVEHGRAVRGAGPGRGADLLRQAVAGAVVESVGDSDRPGGAVGGSPAVRSGDARALAGAASEALGVHRGVGGRVRGDQRGGRRRGPASRAVGAVLAAGLRGRSAARVPDSWPRSSRGCATWVPVGRATRPGCCWRESPGVGAIGVDQYSVDPAEAMFAFQRGCELGFEAACGNYRAILGGGRALERSTPTVDDYPIVLRGSKGAITDRDPAALYARACRQGWLGACDAVR